MATTTNYGWTTPDDTNLVKNGASDIRTLANAIDSTVKTNDNNAVKATIIDAKGDLLAGTAADTIARLGIGANGTVLTADSGETTGLKWATPAGAKSFVLVNSQALTGAATITISGFSGYDILHLIIDAASSANASSEMSIRVNTDSGTNYVNAGVNLIGSATYSPDYLSLRGAGSGNRWPIATMSASASSVVSGYVTIYGAKTTGVKIMQSAATANNPSGNSHEGLITGGTYSGASAITSISIVSSTGNFDAGTLYVYGAA